MTTLRAPNGNPFQCSIRGNRASMKNNGDELSRECTPDELEAAKAALASHDVQAFGLLIIDGLERRAA